MVIKINGENNEAEKIEVSVPKTYKEKIRIVKGTNYNSHIGREVGEELIENELDIELELEKECKSKRGNPMKEIRALLVPIAVHESKSAFYKLKLAKVVAVEGGKIATKGAVTVVKGAKVAGGKIQTMLEKHKNNKKKKGGKNEKNQSEDN